MVSFEESFEHFHFLPLVVRENDVLSLSLGRAGWLFRQLVVFRRAVSSLILLLQLLVSSAPSFRRLLLLKLGSRLALKLLYVDLLSSFEGLSETRGPCVSQTTNCILIPLHYIDCASCCPRNPLDANKHDICSKRSSPAACTVLPCPLLLTLPPTPTPTPL